MSIASPHLLSSQFKSLTLNLTSSSFFHGTTPLPTHLTKPPTPSYPRPSPPTFFPPIRAVKKIQGRVICATNDKTVNVEVIRLAPHPKYKRRVRKKKKFQAHDPLNQFNVGDYVQLEKCRPISKTKSFLAIRVPPRTRPQPKEDGSQELGLPLESQQQ